MTVRTVELPTEARPALRVLHLEDSARDAELVCARLAADELPCEMVLVDGRKTFEAAVANQSFDLILCDYNVADYDGMAALRHIRRNSNAPPLIVLSGALGDERAVACLKEGAADYVLKQNLPRLAPAILRALAEVQKRRQLEEAQCALQESEERLQMIVDSVNDHALIMLDAEGKILSWNHGAETITGYAASEALGLHYSRCFVPEDAAGRVADHALKATLAEGRFQEEGWCVCQDGSRFWADVVIAPVLDAQRQLRGFSMVTRDTTERKQTESLRLAKEAAESASRAKSEFLAIMSHELRTPLNGILGMNELLLNTPLTPQQRMFVTACSTSGKALLQQINDVLDLSKIEAGKLDLDVRDCPLEPLVFEIAAVFTHAASQKGLNLSCQVDPAACVTVMADDTRLRQVLLNLLGNAFKFTTSGGVTLRVSVSRRDGRLWTLRFAVSDTGIGVPEKSRDRLFSPFSQVDGSTARHFGGTGLGLSVCKQLIELMGGRIDFESQVGVGSTFWFEVPFTLINGEEDVARQRRVLTGTRILAVHGGDKTRLQVSECLRAWACETVEAASLPEALNTLGGAKSVRTPFQVVLADCRVVQDDEWRRLAQMAQQFQLPIVGLGASLHDEALTHLRRVGVSRILHDPVRPSELFNVLRSVLATTPIEAACEAQGHSVSLPEALPNPAHVLVAEDNRINQIYVVELLKHFGCTCDLAVNGDEAVQAVQEKTYALVLMDCHMPELDGFAAAREIRCWEQQMRRRARLPLIAVTANALKGDRERCLEAGMDHYLSKPIDSTALREVLVQFLGRRQDDDVAINRSN